MPPKMSAKHTPVQIPTTEGMRYKRPWTPDIMERSVPTLWYV
jgi:hypothetical protein